MSVSLSDTGITNARFYVELECQSISFLVGELSREKGRSKMRQCEVVVALQVKCS